MRHLPKVIFSILSAAILFGCGTSYEGTALRSWSKMKSGAIDSALQDYEKNVTGEKEKLLRLMDEGMLLRVGKRYEESNQKFFAAAKIIEMNGYLSLGEQAVSLLVNEKQTTYQGEDFEKVLVHLYLGLNFLSLNQPDSALVEMRRVNEILFKMISEGKRPYELNAFARYLGGVLFENENNENDAYVAYKNTASIDPELADQFDPLRTDLVRMAKRMGFEQDLDKYKKEFGNEAFAKLNENAGAKDGAVLLLVEVGKSPEKYSSREKHMKAGQKGSAAEVWVPVTYYRRRHYRIHSARLKIENRASTTVTLNDIEGVAIRYLKDRMGRMIAKAILQAGVKAGIAVGVGKATNSKELGVLTGLALFLMSEADTRSWLLLPAQLQIAKIYLKPGTYSGTIEYLDGLGSVDSVEAISQIVVKSKKTTILQRRSFD